MSDYELYEKECKKIIEDNEKYIDCFYDYLDEKGLTDRTISNHLYNVSFYLNNFLLYYEPLHMKDGCYHLDAFLGNWFIRKAMWSSVGTIKSTAASIKKFYACMLENDLIEREDYQNLVMTIKKNKDRWIETMEEYDSMSYDEWW